MTKEKKNQVVEEVSQKLAELISEVSEKVYQQIVGHAPIELGESEKLFIRKMVFESVINEVMEKLNVSRDGV